MIKANNSYSEIQKSLQEHLDKNSENKINQAILEEILGCLKTVHEKCYLSTETPENFINLNHNSLMRNFKVPEFNFFIEFETYYHDYVGDSPYRQEIPSAFLKITANDNYFKKIKNILVHEDDKDLIIPFYYIDKQWKIPLYGFSYDYKKSNLIPLFPVNKQKMDIEKDDDFIKKENSYFIHYLLEIYKRMIFINFNKNVDLIYVHKNNSTYKTPHIYLKKEQVETPEEWLTNHKFDREKFYHLNNILNYGIELTQN